MLFNDQCAHHVKIAGQKLSNFAWSPRKLLGHANGDCHTVALLHIIIH